MTKKEKKSLTRAEWEEQYNKLHPNHGLHEQDLARMHDKYVHEFHGTEYHKPS